MTTESFPPEITREILLKLPVESLLRCKSVCKEWYSLISDHHFIKSHYTLSSTNINYKHHRLIYTIYAPGNDLYNCPIYDVLFHKSANNTLLLEIPFQQTRGFRIVGSCNGLVCLLGVHDNALFIYNPSTRTTNVLPPSKQGVFYGFGYDETTHDYKVIKIWRCDRTSRDLGAMIYSLKAGSWKEIGRFPRVYLFSDGKFINGALYWLTCDCRGSCHIVSLDLGKETYGEVLQPEYDEGSKRLSLRVLGESLCVLCNYDESCVVDVWVMKVYEVKDSWTKLACVPYPIDIWWNEFLDPLCILKDGKLLLRFGSQLLVYDSKDGLSPEIVNFDGIYDVLFDESVVNNVLQHENPLHRTRSQRVSIIGSCNGLLCILVTDDNTLFIYNPSTRRTNILPPSKQVVSALRFSYGFGYDETTHDYKVVKLWRCERPSPPYWDTLIYSLKAGSWKAIGRFPFVNPFNDGIFLNGAFHWANGYATWTSQDIVALDLGKKTYSEVLQPEYDEGRKRLTLGVFGEWLSVFCNYYEKRVVDVWVMKVYGVKDSWTKLLSIPYLNDRNSVPLYMKIHAPLCTSNDGKLLLHLGTKLVVYDCINGSCSVIENTHKFRDACIVVESLISPFAPLGLGDNNGDEN